MIVHRTTGVVWRFFMGAILDAVERGALHADDDRVTTILDWLGRPGAEVCACGLDLDHVGACAPRWWR